MLFAATVNDCVVDRNPDNGNSLPASQSARAGGNWTDLGEKLENAGTTIVGNTSIAHGQHSNISSPNDDNNDDYDQSDKLSNDSGHVSSKQQNNISNDKANDDNSADDMLLSYSQYLVAQDVLKKLTYIALPFALCVTVVNVVVFLQKPMRTSTSRYVVGLSLAQILYLCINIGFYIILAVVEDLRTDLGYYVFGLYFQSFTYAVARRGSYIVMCLVSLERLYAIARPLHVKSFFLVRFPASSVVTAYVFTAAFHFYLLSKYTVEPRTIPTTGETGYRYQPTEFYLQHPELVDTFSIVAKIIFTYIPLVALIVLNALTLWFLRRYALVRRAMKASADDDVESKRQRQLTVTILGATFCYIILSLPLAVHTITASITSEYSRRNLQRGIGYVYVMFQTFSNVCILLSCFTDFLSFLLLSSAYRRTFFRLFRVCRGNKETDKTQTIVDSFTSQTTN
ncbi:putative G-protein coupled receptor F59B2.13 [Littorina saxatilis]|uniref:putative G-protein coupled receptor F59B2.13 n=1 Tax=Littorina saxatilis TaxID=31220 RepID=UPI0038B56DAD